MQNKNEYLKKLLNILWLRPESALAYAEILYKASEFLGEDSKCPILEFGCMDGTNTFILLGGEFDFSYDLFKEVTWTKDSHKSPTLSDDYYNNILENTTINIKTGITKPFDYGIDWSDTHVTKAERTGCYKKCIKIDIESPTIPIGDGEIKTIWAPNIYLTNNFAETLSELRRILSDDGRIITIAPDIKQLDYMLYSYANDNTREWLKDLDRGRYIRVSRHCRSYNDWEKSFSSLNLRVTRHERFIDPLVARVYDLGLRPMFPVFLNMYDKLHKISKTAFEDVKQQWIDTIFHFTSPLCNNAHSQIQENEKPWHIFELQKI